MKVSYTWLKEFVDFNLSPEELSNLLTQHGLEVTGISTFGQDISNVVIGQVLTFDAHPQADKLHLCKVTDGKTEYTVVCGAPNVAAGQKVPFALPQASLPQGVRILPRTIRGIKSEGMICSTTELGLEQGNSTGIMVLPSNAPVGQDFPTWLGLTDTILELEITANRGDCLSHLGIAREIAALLNLHLHLPSISSSLNPVGTDETSPVTVKILADYCTRYYGKILTNLKVTQSPWLFQNRLVHCGLRPVNNIVDITNYVLLEYGHPLHAFDFTKIQGTNIFVRYAKSKETILCLDGKQRTLNPEIPVIANEQCPIALAGIMGSAGSAVVDTTQTIFLESAYFQSSIIRRASKLLGLVTESSYRFERGVDWESVKYASDRTVYLLTQSCPELKVIAATDVITRPLHRPTIQLPVARVRKILDFPVGYDEIVATLQKLNFTIIPESTPELIHTTPPGYRNDIKNREDIIEEIIRIQGYDKIPVRITGGNINLNSGLSSDNNYPKSALKQYLRNWCFTELINYSLVSEQDLSVYYPSESLTEILPYLRIANPVSRETAYLRPSLIPGILRNLRHNLSYRQENLRVYEFGTVFIRQKETPTVQEKEYLTILLMGNNMPVFWDNHRHPGPDDFYTISGLVSRLVELYGTPSVELIPEPNLLFTDNLSWRILINQIPVGIMGHLNQVQLGLNTTLNEIYLAEIDYTAFKRFITVGKFKQYRVYSLYPTLTRDLSLIVPDSISYNIIKNTIYQLTEKVIKEITVFDLYRDKNLPANHHSLSLTLEFKNDTGKLTTVEVDQWQNKITSYFNDRYQIKLRVKEI